MMEEDSRIEIKVRTVDGKSFIFKDDSQVGLELLKLEREGLK